MSRRIEALDAYQRRHRRLGFPIAVLYKFSDDQGGFLAALITYYGFLSLFPLLLLTVTVLGFLLFVIAVGFFFYCLELERTGGYNLEIAAALRAGYDFPLIHFFFVNIEI